MSSVAEALEGRQAPAVRRSLSRTAVAVCAALAAVAITMCVVTGSVLRDQERRLLHERSKEIASAVTNTIGTGQSSLVLLSGVPARSGYSATRFAAAARALTGPAVLAVGVVVERAGGPTVVAAVGKGPDVGAKLTGARAALIRRAIAAGRLTTELLHTRQGERLSLAAPGPGGAVAYEDTAIDPRNPSIAPGAPYSELDVMAYASPRPSPSQLLGTNVSPTSSPSGFEHTVLAVGASRWLLLTRAREPLVGTFAASVPWIILGIGLFTAALVTALVEILARRRRYALGLVAHRTSELREALERQVRLELDQRSARHAADRANHAKSEFLSRMSHELRTPLNAVIGFGQLVQMAQLDDRARQHVGHIVKAGRHLLDLINEVLELSRIEEGVLHISLEPVPVDETVQEAVSLVAPLAATRSIALSVDLSALGDESHVYADRQRLKQVLLNLLSNAIKYNRDNGDVTVSARPSGDGRIAIAVADTGPGIPAEHFASAFEPFERLGAEHGEIPGTGLGLTLSKRLVDAMGGSIALESELGSGTTLTVELAAADGPSGGPVTSVSSSASASHRVIDAPSTGRHRILYIEDNLSNLTLIEHILQRQPATELIPAMQGTIGLELAREHRPDLIMLDLHLPDMPGEDVLRELKADSATAAIPVVVLSADAGRRRAERLIELGAADYLTKPLDVATFLDVTAAQLALHATVGGQQSISE